MFLAVAYIWHMHLALGIHFAQAGRHGTAQIKGKRQKRKRFACLAVKILGASLISAMKDDTAIFFEQAKSTQAFFQGFQRYHFRMFVLSPCHLARFCRGNFASCERTKKPTK